MKSYTSKLLKMYFSRYSLPSPSSLNKKPTHIEDTLVMTEEHLDVALAKICTTFDTHTYAKIQVKYSSGYGRVGPDIRPPDNAFSSFNG